MVGSSSEYPITKLGMPPHLLRKRDKPLRTYGRKSASTPEPRGLPAAKKTRLEQEGDDFDSNKSSIYAPKDSHQACGNSPLPSTEEAPRSSILKYFKLVAPESKAESLENKTTDMLPKTRTRRKPRLLRIRCTSLQSSISSKDTVSLCDRDIEEADLVSSVVSTRSKGLNRGGDNLHDQIQRHGRSNGNTKNRSWAKHSPAVQTTLNISSQAAFAECKVCDTVWNPLYPGDVKYHDKRHKAVQRLKRKREDDES